MMRTGWRRLRRPQDSRVGCIARSRASRVRRQQTSCGRCSRRDVGIAALAFGIWRRPTTVKKYRWVVRPTVGLPTVPLASRVGSASAWNTSVLGRATSFPSGSTAGFLGACRAPTSPGGRRDEPSCSVCRSGVRARSRSLAPDGREAGTFRDANAVEPRGRPDDRERAWLIPRAPKQSPRFGCRRGFFKPSFRSWETRANSY